MGFLGQAVLRVPSPLGTYLTRGDQTSTKQGSSRSAGGGWNALALLSAAMACRRGERREGYS